MQPEEREERLVRGEPERAPARQGQAAVRVGPREADHVAPLQHLVPAREGLVGRTRAAKERVAGVEAVEADGEQQSQTRPPPLAVAVQQLDAPRARRRPTPVKRRSGAGRERVRREGRAAEPLHVLHGVARVPVEPERRVPVEAESEHVAGRRRQLGADQDEHAVAVALERLRVEVVVIGDRDEREAGRPRRGDHFLGASRRRPRASCGRARRRATRTRPSERRVPTSGSGRHEATRTRVGESAAAAARTTSRRQRAGRESLTGAPCSGSSAVEPRAQLGGLVGLLPGELGLGAPEVPVGRGLAVDRPAQVEVLDDARAASAGRSRGSRSTRRLLVDGRRAHRVGHDRDRARRRRSRRRSAPRTVRASPAATMFLAMCRAM